MDIKSNGYNNILIVDDTPENVKVLGTMLMEEGFNISVAQSGKEAISITDKKLPNLILLDINMDELDGIETCRELKNDPSKCSVPVIFLTAYTDIEYKQQAFAAGGVDYITKPFQKEEVLARVRTHLEMEAYKNYLEQEVSVRTRELQVANKNLEIEILKTRQAEEALLRSQKMETVGNLAGGLAHDLNNILSGITGSVSIIQHKIDDEGSISNERLSKYLSTIIHACRRSSTLVNQLLSMSKKVNFKVELIDLNKTVENTVNILENSIDKTIKINKILYPKKPIVKADPSQIEQVLLNLGINAAHAMTVMKKGDLTRGGALTISVDKITADKYFCDKFPDAREVDYFLLTVKDTGVGIKKEIINKIFNPFFTTKTEMSGTGLGLSICYNIIHKHNGIIDVYSEIGVGTEINVYLPVAKTEYNNSDLIAKKNKIVRGEGTVLVIDDEEVIRLTMSNILSECGYDVILTSTGEEGLDEYGKPDNKIDLVILDLNLPDMTSEEIFKRIRDANSDAKVVIASGFHLDKRVDDLVELGANGTINKPFTIYDVSEVISKFIK